jgi:hypothetical protein
MEEPTSARWTSPLAVEDAADLSVDGFRGALPKGSAAPAISLARVDGAVIRDSRAMPGTGTFLSAGDGVRDAVLMHNDLRGAKKTMDGKAAKQVKAIGNLERRAPAVQAAPAEHPKRPPSRPAPAARIRKLARRSAR